MSSETRRHFCVHDVGYSRMDEEMPSALPLHQILFMLDGDGTLVQGIVVWSSSVLGC